MIFNLYFSTADATFNIFGLNKESLETVVDAYLLGKESVTVVGRKYSLKDLTTLKIFEHNADDSPEKVADYYLRNIHYRKKDKNGHHYLPLTTLQKIGKDVTYDFLGNLEYGAKSVNPGRIISTRDGSKEHLTPPKKTLNALSTNSEDGYLIREGLSNKGLLGFLSSSGQEETFGLEEFLITFSRGQDYFYTLDTSKEKFDNRRPIKKGVLGYARKVQQLGYHQLHRFFSDKHQTHLYIVNPNLARLKDEYDRNESIENPIYIKKTSAIGDNRALYLYSNSDSIINYFTPLIEGDEDDSYTRFDNDNETEGFLKSYLKELENLIKNSDIDFSQVEILRETKSSITVHIKESMLNFYVNLQRNGEYFTVRRNPEPDDEPYIIHEIKSWAEVIQRFVKWIADIKSVLPEITALVALKLNEVDSQQKSSLKKDDYLPFFLAEGQFGQTQDQLDFQYDIESLASIISMKDVEPPLAIGLFGKWGTGKSFFMQKLNERITFNSESSSDNYIKRVVQVKFNSWHYSDTNLWASLITQIFESLNDYAKNHKIGDQAVEELYKNLNLTSIQIEQTRKRLDCTIGEKKNLEVKVEDVNERIKIKKERLQLWNAGKLITIVYNDPLIKSDFDGIIDQFKNEKLIEKIEEVDQRLTEVDTAADRIIKSIEIINNKKGRWLHVWLLFALLLLIVWLFNGPFNDYVGLTVKRLIIVFSTIVTVLAPLKKLYPYYRKINQFYERLKSLRETIEKEKEKVRLNEHKEISELESIISKLENAEAELQKELHAKIEEKQRLEAELKDIGTGKMLSNFLEKKSIDENYFKQLGIISWIRKDFSKLNDLFEQQRSVKSSIGDLEQESRLEIDRIVLYIDDLDRCNEELVVKVLEAIHLILAFPLFVVVVGVDPRWMNNAINKKYKDLFGSSGHSKIINDNNLVEQNKLNDSREFLAGIASSYDYLEKIFQIPFSLKPINKTSRENLIAYLVRNEMNMEEQEQNNDQLITEKRVEENKIPIALRIEDNKEKQVKQETEETKRVIFTNYELELMQNLSPLFGHTPRGINRYVNIYRILKCHRGLKIQGNFSENQIGPIMFVLAIVVGYSVFAKEFIQVLHKSNNSKTLKMLLEESDFSEELKEIVKRNVNVDLHYFSLPIESLKENLELISRFSFRTLID